MAQATQATKTREAAATATMRAVVQDSYGAPDVLKTASIDRPKIAANEVLIQVRAAGIDRGTWHTVTGRPYLMRILGFGFSKPKHRVPGLEIAGTVVETGSAVTRLAVGDEVYGVGRGSFAEYAAALEDKLARKPKNTTFEQAAALPISGTTGLRALIEAGRLEAGQKVLIIGASGGIGTIAVQIAKAIGAEVTGVASTSKVDLVKSLGADHVIDYTNQDFADGSRQYDLIVDLGGNTPVARLRKALTAKGTLVIVGGESGGSITGGIGRGMRAQMLSRGPQRMVMLMPKEHHSVLEQLTPFVESGAVTPSIDRTYTLDQVADAVRRIEAGQARGKLVLSL